MTNVQGPTGAYPLALKVVIPDDFPPVMADSSALARLKKRPGLTIEVFNSRPADEADLSERISGAHTVLAIRSATRFTEPVLASAPSLKHLALWGTATDNVSLNAARRLGIAVTNTPDTATIAVAEHALGLALSLARKIPELDQRVREGEWPRGLLTQLAGKTMGVVGTGSVGRRLAELARGIGMEVVATSVRAEQTGETPVDAPPWLRLASLAELLHEADVVSIHARLSESTVRMFGARQFALMKPTALFVNTARGGLIDEVALAEALRNEAIGGAALDVFSHEPVRKDTPLRYLPNVILSPHTAATTAEALNAGLNMAVDNVIGFLSGQVKHRVG